MKKLVLLGMALVVSALLIFSCNKNRFDFENLESIEGSGQWKLPIGSLYVTLGQVIDQLEENNLLSYDENGNYQIRYDFAMEEILKGSEFLNLGTMTFGFEMHINDQDTSLFVIQDSIYGTLRFSQEIKLSMDSAGIETAVIKSGELLMSMVTDIGHVTGIVFSSSDIIMPNNDTLTCYFNEMNNTVDIAGATFEMRKDPVTGMSDSTLVFNYEVHYEVTDLSLTEFDLATEIGLVDVKVQEISGYIDHYEYDFTYDTTFALPISNLYGGLSLVGVDLQVQERNTFGLNALLDIDQAEFYGQNGLTAPLFSQYPCTLQVHSTPYFTNVMPENGVINDHLSYHTDCDGFRFASRLILNPDSGNDLIMINDTSALGLAVSALVPCQFNIPGVSYVDTVDINVSGITGPELVREIILGIIFKSQMPFNLSAQFYTIDSLTGQISDSLMANALRINGSFDGTLVETEADISVTHERLNSLMAANKLIMRLGIDTQDLDVYLNRETGLGVTIKADIFYDGEIEIDQLR
ncbi:MAG: hypothetical protein IKU00_02680 [Bacteroidales bacterium]|nr:hypothetical protein [Bacteroidales bacterium]MBR4146780.1 hypothetical protein [Bacteroidales bacterium]